MRSIAIMNNKGGVGKTVTAINLADILVRQYGQRVVLVDCDGQANLTRFYLPEFDPAYSITVADVLAGDHEPVWCDNLTPVTSGLELLPGSSALYDMDLRTIRDGLGDPYTLQLFAAAAEDDGETDFMIFDCPPGYTLASVSALLAADEAVIPMLVDGFSFGGMMDMREQLKSLQEAGPRVAGVLITQWRNTPVVREGENALRLMDVPVFQTVIRRTDKVPESTIAREPLAVYSPKSAAGMDYRAWVRELMGEEAANRGQGEV